MIDTEILSTGNISSIFPSNKMVFFALIIVCLIFFQKANAQIVSNEELILQIANSAQTVPYSEYSKWFSFTPSLSLETSYRSEIENVNFYFQENILYNLFLTQRHSQHTKKNVKLAFEKETARIFLEKLAQTTDRPAVDAKFKMIDGKAAIFVADENGFQMDIEKDLEVLSGLFKNSAEMHGKKEVDLPYLVLSPQIKARDVNDIGINTLIGEGKSNFKGSSGSRIHNIKVATAKYDGILLAPGEEFSFVNILGEVDGEHGYLPELVIKQDKTEPEFGGGICQVSTTAFRAAIYSGLEITARKNHAYPVAYYNPQGMDATIYVPRPDLKFKNNTPGHILFQTNIVGTELIFSVYGTDDGRKIEVDGPHILKKNPDGSMQTVFTQKVTNKNGQEIIKDTFNSFYDSPSKYPHPSQEKFTKKPSDWSNKQWDMYKKANGL